MALAKYLDKAALSASQVLNSFDSNDFEDILNSHAIGVLIDANATNTHEGRCCADLSIRLLARLYPKVTVFDVNGECSEHVKELESLAVSINPEIETCSLENCTVILSLCKEITKNESKPKFFIGSDAWISKFSVSKPQGFGDTNNPFGAGAAACFGAANIFRHIFKDQLPYGQTDTDFTFSVLEHSTNQKFDKQYSLDEINIGELHLIGIGAIGNAALWGLKNSSSISGSIQLIDHEVLDHTNLQRYVLSIFDDIDRYKVDYTKEQLKESKLKPNPHVKNWQSFIDSNKDKRLEAVAVCLDSGVDRIAVQSSLPKKIFNAWTQLENLGVSRHFDFIKEPCLACLYLPDQEIPSISEEVARNFNIDEKEVRKYLAQDKVVDNRILDLIYESNSIQKGILDNFKGVYFKSFYSKVVCGGMFLKITGKDGESKSVEVPSAFESALSGILLAAEVVIDCADLRTEKMQCVSNINLMRPISKHIQTPHSKQTQGNCLCEDADYIKAYSKRYLQSK